MAGKNPAKGMPVPDVHTISAWNAAPHSNAKAATAKAAAEKGFMRSNSTARVSSPIRVLEPLDPFAETHLNVPQHRVR